MCAPETFQSNIQCKGSDTLIHSFVRVDIHTKYNVGGVAVNGYMLVQIKMFSIIYSKIYCFYEPTVTSVRTWYFYD